MQKPSWATQAITKRYVAGQTGLLLPGSIYKRAGVVMDAMQVTADVNQAAMTASAIISTPTPDRSEDVVEPRGIKLDNYRRNPVVLFDHGEKIPGPVATCESPSGELSIRVYNDRVEATSYFSQSIPVSYQIFAMIAEKFIRATSVNFEPITARARSRGRGERPGLHVSEWDLLEWSWVTIGDNPEAVRKLLDRGRIAGDVLCGPIRKSLASLAARQRRNQIQGFSPMPIKKECGQDSKGRFDQGNTCAAGDGGSDTPLRWRAEDAIKSVLAPLGFVEHKENREEGGDPARTAWYLKRASGGQRQRVNNDAAFKKLKGVLVDLGFVERPELSAGDGDVLLTREAESGQAEVTIFGGDANEVELYVPLGGSHPVDRIGKKHTQQRKSRNMSTHTNIAKKLFGDDEEAAKKKVPPKATGKPPVGKAAAAPPVDDDEAAAAEAESEEGGEIPQDESAEFGGDEAAAAEMGEDGAAVDEDGNPLPPDDEAAAAEMGEDGGMETGVDGDPSLLADEDSRAPLGAQLYEATHEALGGMAQAIEDQMGPLEHPDAKNYLTKLISILQGIQTELQQLHGEHYPDRAGKLAVDGEAEADPVGTGGESMPPKGIQKLLSMSPVAKSRMRACTGRLEYIAKSNQVSRRARQALREVIDAVHGELRSVKTARIKKSVQPAEPEVSAVEREALERFEKLQSRATEVLAKLEDAIPANRK